MATEILLTGKGQFTLNKSLLAHLQVRPGEKIILKKLPNNGLRIEAVNKQKDFMRLAGFVRSDVVLTDKELQEAICSSYAKDAKVGLL